MNMKKALLMIPLFLAATTARAEFSFSCGEGREKGPEQAEVGLVDSLEASITLYLNGKEVDGDSLGVKPTDAGLWIASIDEGEGKGTRTFEFSQKNKNVTEFYSDAKGKTKKVGAAKVCVFKRVEPKP